MIKTESGRHVRFHALAAAWAAVFASTSMAGVLYVDRSAVGAGNGTSWTDAFADLQAALAAAEAGDEVWVAEGTYLPGVPGDTAASFQMKSGVTVLGGFSGTEYYRSQRDPVAHPTVLSGDLGQDDTYGSGAWYVGWNIHTPNSAHVVTAIDVDAGAVLDGFEVRCGYAASSSGPGGGGIYIQGGAPTIRGCTFTRNLAGFSSGGAALATGSNAVFESCTFHQNWVHLGKGGGVCATGTGTAVILGCVFSENYCTSGSGGSEGQGAGLSLWMMTSARVEGCTFRANHASQFNGAGGYELARGGGLSCFLTPLLMKDCTFRSNSAPAGGGASLWNSAEIINCEFWDNLCYETTLSGGWSDGGYGGGLMVISFQPVDATLVNCVVARNRGFEAAGFESFQSARTVLRNSIVWGNVASNPEVGPRRWQFKGAHSIEYSCVQDLLTPDPGEDPPDESKYPGCQTADPLFTSLASGVLSLTAASACIDAGRNSDVPAGTATDLTGNARRADDPAKPDTGVGPAPVVDMGAHEYGSSPCGPTITSHPTDATVCAGGPVLLEVVAAGATAYQWRVDEMPIPGATASTLELPSAGPGDAGPYDCVVTNDCGSVTSLRAMLTVENCCPADFDGTGFVDTDDFDAFVRAFEAGTDNADFDGTGFVDTDDFDAFVRAFEAGC
ncbi:MAG: right-handed parallel beta-helix repeat-containing protein [Phycisphaerales bacterium]|nr:right-handed parallel beta-helix repeat-containing protein [Phycisphaerales bacterium]